MKIQLSGKRSHKLKLTYVTESPSWKPSYRITLAKNGKIQVQAWAIVDNTSGEDWQAVKLGVGASSAMSFRFDLRHIRVVARETLRADDLFAQAPPLGGASYGSQQGPVMKNVLAELDDSSLADEDSKEKPKSGAYPATVAMNDVATTAAGAPIHSSPKKYYKQQPGAAIAAPSARRQNQQRDR